ncbi:MAG: tellurite-resistance/dicarboxylate transporter [Candidatus Heimdallarchaeaceae archaeon]
MVFEHLLEHIHCKCEIIKNFTPSWFASVMGTGILAITTLFYSQYISWFQVVAEVLFYFNIGLFVLLCIPWILRWILFPKNALADFKHPVICNFYPTIAIGMLVLSSNFLVIGHNLVAGEIFWFIATALTLIFGISIPTVMFLSEEVKLEHINPAWFIPPVGLIVIPIPGSLLIQQFSGFSQEVILFLNYVGWGAGFFIYLALLAVCMYRFILHSPLPNLLAPTIWINLGPIGAGTVALYNLVNNSAFITVKEPFHVFGLIFWGFGIWWVLMAIVITIHYIRKITLPYAMSWWAFTFPLGAYVASSHLVAIQFNLSIIDYIGFALYWLLFGFWSITLIRTAINTYKGKVFASN